MFLYVTCLSGNRVGHDYGMGTAPRNQDLKICRVVRTLRVLELRVAGGAGQVGAQCADAPKVCGAIAKYIMWGHCEGAREEGARRSNTYRI